MKSQGQTQKRKVTTLLSKTVTSVHISRPTLRDYAELMLCFGTADLFDDRLCRKLVDKLATRIRGASWPLDQTGTERARMRFLLASGIRSALHSIVDAYRAGHGVTAEFGFDFPLVYRVVIGEKVAPRQLGASRQKDRPRSSQIWVECETVEQMIVEGFLTLLRNQSADQLCSQLRTCAKCGQLFFGRSQARTCSQRCRTALYRSENPDKQQESQIRAEVKRAAREGPQPSSARVTINQRLKTREDKKWKKT